MNIRYFMIFVLSVFIASCANTEVMQSWHDNGLSRAYKRPLIIGISDSQQTRRIYEKYFAGELKKVNVNAIPSYKLISSKQKMNRETVVKTVRGTDVDAVIMTYLVSSEHEINYHDSPLNQGYSGDVESSRMSDTLVSTRGRTSSAEIITLKTDLYDVKTKSLVWTAQTRTVAPESIDEVVTDVTALLIKQMVSDGLIK